MPEREQIIQELKKIRIKPMNLTEAKDPEIWEGDDSGAHFMLTKESLYKTFGVNLIVYALSVSGLYTGKEKVISDFLRTFGEPVQKDINLLDPDPSFILWDASTVDRFIKRSQKHQR